MNHVDKIASQTPLFYAAREGHLDMCKILIEAGCDISHQDLNHKNASHYAKRYNSSNDVYDYLSNELQNMKDNKRIGESKGLESNQEDKNPKKNKKR